METNKTEPARVTVIDEGSDQVNACTGPGCYGMVTKSVEKQDQAPSGVPAVA